MFKVTLQSTAIADLEESANWYAERSPELGERFLAAVLAALSELENAPQRLAILTHGIHRWPVDRFSELVSGSVNATNCRPDPHPGRGSG